MRDSERQKDLYGSNQTKPLTMFKSPTESDMTDAKDVGNVENGGKTLPKYCTDFHIWSVIDKPVGFSNPDSCDKNNGKVSKNKTNVERERDREREKQERKETD